MAKRENDLGRDPIGKLLLRLAVPTVTAQLVNALYNILSLIHIGPAEAMTSPGALARNTDGSSPTWTAESSSVRPVCSRHTRPSTAARGLRCV